jgi:hypothetical protein
MWLLKIDKGKVKKERQYLSITNHLKMKSTLLKFTFLFIATSCICCMCNKDKEDEAPTKTDLISRLVFYRLYR